jgi:5'-deoxynucleotidase YfbR-like HD superfamily hydrolase
MRAMRKALQHMTQNAAPQSIQPSTETHLWDRIRKLEHDNNQAAARIQELEGALTTIRDCFWRDGETYAERLADVKEIARAALEAK